MYLSVGYHIESDPPLRPTRVYATDIGGLPVSHLVSSRLTAWNKPSYYPTIRLTHNAQLSIQQAYSLVMNSTHGPEGRPLRPRLIR